VRACRGGNRGVGVGYDLRDDLDQVDPALSEVLAKVAATDGADVDSVA
jgi:hypothetical protein